MKKYSKEVLEGENKIIMRGHEQASKASIIPLMILITASVGGAVVFALYHLVNAIFA